MPRNTDTRSSTAGGSGGHGRGRYAAVVEKGESAWKREWSSFISGVNLKRLQDGTSGVVLKASADIEHQLAAVDGNQAIGGDAQVTKDGVISGASASTAGFAYLFSSAADRRAERDARDKADKERRQVRKRELMAKRDPLSVLSKHQRAVYEAQQRGLQLDGMSRKERRDFLHLTVSEAQKKAEEQSREFKLHDLMDERLAWYQQGPHPIDLIAETLVRRKADKKAKQLSLKYNYLTPHPSWIAKRAQRRRESLLVGLGKRLIFSERASGEATEVGAHDSLCEIVVTDPLHHVSVPLKEMGRLLGPHPPPAVTAHGCSDEHAEGTTTADEGVQQAEGGAMREHRGSVANSGTATDTASCRAIDTARSGGPVAEKRDINETAAVMVAQARLPNVGVLQDPSRIATSFVRRVVRDRTTALAIQQLNRRTKYLSSDLVKGPSLLPEDTPAGNGPAARAPNMPKAAASAPTLLSTTKSQDTAAAPNRSTATCSSDRKRVRDTDLGEDKGQRRQHRRGGADGSVAEPKPTILKHTTSSSSSKGARPATRSVKLSASAVAGDSSKTQEKHENSKRGNKTGRLASEQKTRSRSAR